VESYLRAVFLAALLLSGCTGATSAIVDTFQSAARNWSGAARGEPQLNPDFSYLRLTIDGRVAYLAGVNIDDRHPGAEQVWFSGNREVIRLLDGRVTGAVGTTTEWRGVLLPQLPSWSVLAKSGEFQWSRVRDVMPGYRFGVKDALTLRVIQPPDKSALQGVDPRSLTWFEERVQAPRFAASTDSISLEGFEALPPARYAVALAGGNEQVVYGEQCLAPAFCFSWQRWSAEPPKPNDQK